MLEDHAVLRDGCRRLQSLLADGLPSSDLVRELGARLETHVRLEDREIFPLLEATLTDEALDEVSRLSSEFRMRWNRPMGPVKGHSGPAFQPVSTQLILFVSDQSRSRDFYTRVLEREATLDVPGMTELQLGGLVLGLMPRPNAETLLGLALQGRSSELYLVVDDPEAFSCRALKNGANLLSPLEPRDWGASVAYVSDPDVHILAFANRQV